MSNACLDFLRPSAIHGDQLCDFGLIDFRTHGIAIHTGAFLSSDMWENHRLITGEHLRFRRLECSLEISIIVGAVDKDEVDLDRWLLVLQADVLKESLHVARSIQRTAENVDSILKIDANTPVKRRWRWKTVEERGVSSYQQELMKSFACSSEM